MRRKTFNRARAVNRSSKRFAKVGYGIPTKIMVKHRYTQAVPVTINTAGATIPLAWSASGMFAPTITPGTPNPHQPLYFDQYAALYDHYVVIGSRCKFTVCSSPASAIGAFTACAILDANSALLSADAIQLAEQTDSTRLVVFSGQEADVKTLTLKYSAKKTYGGSILANNELKGSATVNPTEDQVFALVLTAGPSSGVQVLVNIEIEYIAIWTELKEVSQS